MRAAESLLHRTAAIAMGRGEMSPASLKAPEEQPGQQTAPVAMAVDSNMVVILASLLCALVCILGLALVSRCACRRRRSSSSDHSSPPPKGLKKKAIDALPTVSFASAGAPDSTSAAATWCSSSECAICLAEFAEGEELRVLPRCGHGFHATCVDAWLRTCASCPSCRTSIVAAEEPALSPLTVVVVVEGGSRCGRCGEVAAPSAGDGDATPTFLP
ncbi:unnamed protein product [Alopecurus aequalis]